MAGKESRKIISRTGCGTLLPWQIAHYLERKLRAYGDCLGVGRGNTTAYLAIYVEARNTKEKKEAVSLSGNVVLHVSMNPFLRRQENCRKTRCVVLQHLGSGNRAAKGVGGYFQVRPMDPQRTRHSRQIFRFGGTAIEDKIHKCNNIDWDTAMELLHKWESCWDRSPEAGPMSW